MRESGESMQRRWRNRPVQREIDDRRVRRMGRIVLSLVVAAAPTAIYLLQQNETLKVVYELNSLRSEQERLSKEERRLNLERARLESLARIGSWAARKQGLVRPEPEDVVVVRAEEAEAAELVASAPGKGTKAVR
jgi:cell division protein FtsL